MKTSRFLRRALVFLPFLVPLGCGLQPLAPPSEVVAPFEPSVLGDCPGLHNVFRLTDRLYSGCSPVGETGFQSLRDLGIRTVISVDGAQPEVALAGRFGMQYVHLPMGYDAVPRETAVRIARAVRDLPGPVYIHCHHGKHRGPAAAMAALRCESDRCPALAALEFRRTAGTDPKYKGLYASVEGAKPATPEEWEKAGVNFPEIAFTPDLTRLMVGIDERWDHLKSIRAAGWKSPADHPDIDPAHEALQLVENFREAARLKDNKNRGEAFRKLTTDAVEAAEVLERTLRAKPLRSEEAEQAFTRSATLCAKCHESYRDK